MSPVYRSAQTPREVSRRSIALELGEIDVLRYISIGNRRGRESVRILPTTEVAGILLRLS